MFLSGIHAFWKGQGDRDQIRTTQANIMKQYMDAEADPCHDFYQYACGNWPALNPIPADKAGFVIVMLLYSFVWLFWRVAIVGAIRILHNFHVQIYKIMY